MKRTFLTLATILTLTFNSAYASINPDNIEVKSLKNTKYDNLIQVDIKSDSVDTFIITLVDRDGIELYSDKFVDNKYTKKFSLAIDETDLVNPIKVVVTSKTTGKVNEYTFVPSDVINK